MGEPLETYRISHPWAYGRHGEAFLITKSSDARLLKTRGTRSTSRHHANDFTDEMTRVDVEIR